MGVLQSRFDVCCMFRIESFYLGALFPRPFPPVKLEPVLCRCIAPWANDSILAQSWRRLAVRSDTTLAPVEGAEAADDDDGDWSPPAVCDLRSIFWNSLLPTLFLPRFFSGSTTAWTTGANASGLIGGAIMDSPYKFLRFFARSMYCVGAGASILMGEGTCLPGITLLSISRSLARFSLWSADSVS